MKNPESQLESGVRKPDRLPPIGILDLIIVTSGMAIVFTFQEQMAKFGWFPETDNQLFKLVSRLVFAVESGIPLAAMFWLVKQKRITGRFLQQPGHWILFAFGGFTVGIIASGFIYADDISVLGTSSVTLIRSFGYTYLVLSAIFFAGIFFVSWRWRSVFAAYLAASVFSAIRFFVFATLLTGTSGTTLMNWVTQFEFLINGAQALCFVMLLIAVVMDLVQQTRRDWLHWAGVLVIANAIAVSPLLHFIYVRFILGDSVQ